MRNKTFSWSLFFVIGFFANFQNQVIARGEGSGVLNPDISRQFCCGLREPDVGCIGLRFRLGRYVQYSHAPKSSSAFSASRCAGPRNESPLNIRVNSLSNTRQEEELVGCSPLMMEGEKAIEQPHEQNSAQRRREGERNENLDQRHDGFSREIEFDSKKKNHPTLSLEAFRKAVQDYPEAIRLIVKKNKPIGSPDSVDLSIEPSDLSDTNSARLNEDNKKIIAMLKEALKKEYSLENVNELLAHHNLIPNGKTYPTLTTQVLKEILTIAEDYPRLMSLKEMEDAIDLSSINSLEEISKAACSALKKFQEGKEKINEEDELKLEQILDQLKFQIARIGATQAELQEIIKIANSNEERCDSSSINKEKIPILFNLNQFDFQQLAEFIKEAHQTHDELSMMGSDQFLDQVQAAQQKWKDVRLCAQGYQKLLMQSARSVQYEMNSIKKSSFYYKTQKSKLQVERDKNYQSAFKKWIALFEATHEILETVFKEEHRQLLAAKKDFEKSYVRKEENKNSFQQAEALANQCLENKNDYFLQSEHTKSPFYENSKRCWLQALEAAEAEYTRLHIGVEKEKKWAEIEALKKAIEAIQSLELAEQALTKATKIEWVKTEEELQNVWASNALLKSFVDHKSKSKAAIKRVQREETNLSDRLNKICDSYQKLSEILSSSFKKDGWLDLVKSQLQEIKASWNLAQKAVSNTSGFWEKAKRSIEATQESKITWAKTLLRLAATATGNFSLGEATKKEGELLAGLWLGGAISKDEEGFEMSSDGLKRWRPLKYKPGLKKYQMNFERRSDTSKRWQGEEQDGSIAWGNGHLTIINPHAEDSDENSMSWKFFKFSPDQLGDAYEEKATELKMEELILCKRAAQIQDQLNDEKMRSRALISQGNKVEASQLNQKISTLEQNHKEAWNVVFQACQHGIKIAPEDEKDYWKSEMEKAKLRALDSDKDGTVERWEATLAYMQQTKESFPRELEQLERICHILPETKRKLRSFWYSKIEDLKNEREIQDAIALYVRASKEWSAVDKSFREGVNAVLSEQEKIWEELSQRCSQLGVQWKAVAVTYEKIWKKTPPEAYKNQYDWQRMVEAAQDTKNQSYARKMICRAMRADKQFVSLNQKIGNVAGKEEKNALLQEALQQSHVAVKAWKEAEQRLKAGWNKVSEGRKDLSLWWQIELEGIKTFKSKAVITNLIIKGDQASFSADQTYDRAKEAGQEELWNQAIEEYVKARLIWEQVNENIREQTQKISPPEGLYYQWLQDHQKQVPYYIERALRSENFCRNCKKESLRTEEAQPSSKEKLKAKVEDLKKRRT